MRVDLNGFLIKPPFLLELLGLLCNQYNVQLIALTEGYL